MDLVKTCCEEIFNQITFARDPSLDLKSSANTAFRNQNMFDINLFCIRTFLTQTSFCVHIQSILFDSLTYIL